MYYLNICLGGLRKTTKYVRTADHRAETSWTGSRITFFFGNFSWACLFSLDLIYLLTAKLHVSQINSFQKGRKVVLTTHLSHVTGTGYKKINYDKQIQDEWNHGILWICLKVILAHRNSLLHIFSGKTPKHSECLPWRWRQMFLQNVGVYLQAHNPEDQHRHKAIT